MTIKASKSGMKRWLMNHYGSTKATNARKKAYAIEKAKAKYPSVRKSMKSAAPRKRVIKVQKSVNTRRTYWAYATKNAGT